MPIEVDPEEVIERNTKLPKNKNDFIKTMYEQHWISQRAGVSERLQLTYIFSFIFAGFLLILKENSMEKMNLPLIVFLMLFSVFAILFTLKVESVLKARENAANKIVERYGLLDLNAQFDRKRWVTRVPIGKLFPIFFTMCFYFLLFILLNILLPNSKENIQLAVGVSVVLFIISAILLWRLRVY